MTKNSTRLAGRDVALENMQICTADRRLGYLDDCVSGRGDFWLRTLFHGLLRRAQVKRVPSRRVFLSFMERPIFAGLQPGAARIG